MLTVSQSDRKISVFFTLSLMYEKRQKIEFLDLKYLLLAEFSLAESGGTPLCAIMANHPAQKPLAELGGAPPPLTEKIR